MPYFDVEMGEASTDLWTCATGDGATFRCLRNLRETAGMSHPKLNFRLILVLAFAATANVGTAQVVAPQLATFNLTSGASLTLGQAASYTYTTTPGSNPTVSFVGMNLLDAQGHMYVMAQAGASGTLSTPTTNFWLNGSYSIDSVFVQDSAGYQAYFYPNGSILYPGGATGPSTTSLELSTLGFTLSGAPYSSITSLQLTSLTSSRSKRLKPLWPGFPSDRAACAAGSSDGFAVRRPG
jgi:hypothetical protein